MRSWSIHDSEDLYGIPNWGREFLRVNASGNLEIAPRGGDAARYTDLHTLITDLQSRDISLPVLLRFPDLLEARIRTLASSFAAAIDEYGYKGRYRGVFPVKVNQQRQLIDDLVDIGRSVHLGLEAGSKPELMVVLAMMDDPEAVVVCNGYKDEEYVETALMAQKFGRRIIIVIEKFTEVHLCMSLARKHGIKPVLGVRAKLASKGAGRWKASTGDKAKFGLAAYEMVDLVEVLEQSDMLDTLQLLHFHIGSQVSAIRSFKSALSEAARIFVELHGMGAPMRYLDVGGGLGVDYDGSSTNFASSINYTVQEYAYDVVSFIQSACDAAGVPHPDIVTESGRALVAHHAVLVFNVVGASSHPTDGDAVVPSPEDPEPLHDLRSVLTDGITRKNYQAVWHDALGLREQTLMMFNLGLVTLRQRAKAERMFWKIAERISKVISDLSYVPDELSRLHRVLADTYFCNFSVFQSIPDSWAVDQLFPVVPIHRHDQEPGRWGVLADITCDSDGKIDRFIDLHDVKDTLPLHALNDEPYFLAAFLVGAYQEILGDLHNLFGDTNSVIVRLSDSGGYEIESVVEGDTVTEVLEYVSFDRKELLQKVRRACEKAVKAGTLTAKDTARIVSLYREGLDGYTYLE